MSTQEAAAVGSVASCPLLAGTRAIREVGNEHPAKLRRVWTAANGAPAHTLHSPTLTARLSPQATTGISITVTGFDPPTLAIGRGDTVRWVNADVVAHSIRGGEPYQVYLPLVVRS